MKFGAALILALLVAGCASKKITQEDIQSGMDREAIRKVIRDHLREIRGCYEARLKEKPDLYGKIIVQWDIVAGGKAKDAKVIKSLDPVVDECIRAAMLTWQWPEPPPEQVGRVSYPFVFSSE